MNAGELKDKVTLLGVKGMGTDGRWAALAEIWTKTELLPPCFYRDKPEWEEVAMTYRQRAIAPCSAVEWNGRRGVVVDVRKVGKQYGRALVRMTEPKICVATRLKPEKGELNRPVIGVEHIAAFSGYLEEREPQYTKAMPQSVNERRDLLTAPKSADLRLGDQVKIDAVVYTVTTAHTLRPDRNTYEVTAKQEL